MIKLLDNAALTEVVSALEQVKAHLLTRNIDQWDQHYPTRATIQKDLEKQEAFGWYEDGELSAYIVLNTEFDAEYHTIPWHYEEPCLIIHRLFVASKAQGKGIANKLIQFAEHHAQMHKFKSIRLDAFSLNKTANTVYLNHGYRFAGTVTFRKGIFNCYEKQLFSAN